MNSIELEMRHLINIHSYSADSTIIKFTWLLLRNETQAIQYEPIQRKMKLKTGNEHKLLLWLIRVIFESDFVYVKSTSGVRTIIPCHHI
jgi:hypothetical protein